MRLHGFERQLGWRWQGRRTHRRNVDSHTETKGSGAAQSVSQASYVHTDDA